MNAFVFNPLTGGFDIITKDITTLKAGCPSTVSVGQFVYVATMIGSVPQVDTCDVTVLSKMPAVGLVSKKASATACTVIVRGLVSLSGIVAGTRYIVGPSGTLVSSVPGSPRPFIVQAVGYGVATDRLLVNPSQDFLRLNQ